LKKDVLILLAVILGLLILLFGVLGGSKNFREVSWIEKGSGEGPWEIKGLSRKEYEKKLKKNNNITAENIQIKKTTSSHKILFSTSQRGFDFTPYSSKASVPQTKY